MNPSAHPDREPLPTRLQALPALPPDYEAVISAGLPFLGGAAPDEAALLAIAGHIRLLQAWSGAINLTAIRDPADAAREHVLDSLAALPILRRAGVEAFLDLGSGGGFPGVPLAVAIPACRAVLVDSIAKKARFLAVVVAALGLENRVSVIAGRSEDLARGVRDRERWPCVVARAVARLDELAELSLPLVRVGGLFVAWKREPVGNELAVADGAIGTLGGRIADCVPVRVPGLEDHVLVVVEKMRHTAPAYPRDPAARHRAPLIGHGRREPPLLR